MGVPARDFVATRDAHAGDSSDRHSSGQHISIREVNRWFTEQCRGAFLLAPQIKARREGRHVDLIHQGVSPAISTPSALGRHDRDPTCARL